MLRHPGISGTGIFFIGVCLFTAAGIRAQSPSAEAEAEVAPVAVSAAAPIAPFNEARILGVLPDYQTVTDPGHKAAPLTPKQKWRLAFKESADPFNIANAALTAAFSQKGNQTPKYGEGSAAYAERFGAALGDFGSQNLFSAGLLATVFHQDPRYFRRGSESAPPARVAYALSRLVVARQDSGKAAFNISGILGMMMGIAASNLYYPSKSVGGTVMAARLETSLLGGVTGNLISEFWPDLQKKFFRRKHK